MDCLKLIDSDTVQLKHYTQIKVAICLQLEIWEILLVTFCLIRI